MKRLDFLIPLFALTVTIGYSGGIEWRTENAVEYFHFSTSSLTGMFVAHDGRELGKGYGKHGLRNLRFKDHDLHAPEGSIGAKRRHQGILNLYRVYSSTETFGSLRDDEAEVTPLANGALLKWSASEDRPVSISASWKLTGTAQIDVTIEAAPTRKIENFEILPATYVPVEMVNAVYLGTPVHPQLTRLRPTEESDENETYSFHPLGESAREAQKASGRVHSEWKWPTFVASDTAALPIVFAEDDSIQIIQLADPDTVSAVCVTPTPELKDLTEWNNVEKHGALYFSLFGHDVEPGETYLSHIRFLVIDRPDEVEETHLRLYQDFLSSL
ncbi:MAG: hypothetical protein AAF357_09470 [Verrucomicrobiota bacterium]